MGDSTAVSSFHFKTAILLAALLRSICVADGQSFEDRILTTLAPVIYADQADDHPPLTLDYFARHVRLYWYNAPFGSEIGNTGDTPQNIDLILGQIALHRSQGLNYHYALHFVDSGYDVGTNTNEPVTWASQQDAQRGIYGRVASIGAGRYQVQYFLVFGYNNASAPDICGDVPPGSHEGDWIAVDYSVEASDVANPRIYKAIYHDHGRQIFIESPSALTFEGTHPQVFLERGVQDSWPYPGFVGFAGYVPPCISVNKLFPPQSIAGINLPIASEAGYYPVVREHLGVGPRFLVTTVVNVGSKANPGSNSESHFFMRYDGWYGTEYERDCISFPILDTEPPRGPAFQDKIWDRNFVTSRAWPTWENQANVAVDFGYLGIKTGSTSQPFSKLSEALPIVSANGIIAIKSGQSSERLTIFEPCIITASGGSVTIGQ